jgi:hypothetical protein
VGRVAYLSTVQFEQVWFRFSLVQVWFRFSSVQVQFSSGSVQFRFSSGLEWFENRTSAALILIRKGHNILDGVIILLS